MSDRESKLEMAKGLMLTTEKALREYGPHLTSRDIAEIRRDLDRLRTTIESERWDELDEATRRLEQAPHRLAEEDDDDDDGNDPEGSPV